MTKYFYFACLLTGIQEMFDIIIFFILDFFFRFDTEKLFIIEYFKKDRFFLMIMT
jgi:hypothetical protein